MVLLTHFNTRTRFHIPSRTLTLISSSPSLSTSCMSSSLEYGRPSSPILYGSSILWVQIKFRSSILGTDAYSRVVLVPDPPLFQVPRNCAVWFNDLLFYAQCHRLKEACCPRFRRHSSGVSASHRSHL